MYGWRATLGMITPGVIAGGGELYPVLPRGVSILEYCLGIRELTRSDVERALENYEAAVAALARRGVDIINLGGSPPVIVGGYGADHRLMERARGVTSIPVTTSQTAAVEALRYLGVTRVAVTTPFPDELNELLRAFLEQSGFRVVSLVGLGRPYEEVRRQPPAVAYRLAKQAYAQAPEAEAVYMAGGALPAVEVVELLERDLKVPVVASLLAALWNMLRLLRIAEPSAGYGRLLQGL